MCVYVSGHNGADPGLSWGTLKTPGSAWPRKGSKLHSASKITWKLVSFLQTWQIMGSDWPSSGSHSASSWPISGSSLDQWTLSESNSDPGVFWVGEQNIMCEHTHHVREARDPLYGRDAKFSGRDANLLFPNRSAMARVLSLWRSIEKKKGSESETSRQSRQMSGYK